LDPKDANSITYDTWTLPTMEGRRPVTVSMELRMPKGGTERLLNIEVEGLLHPYCTIDYNYTGEAIKNPALLRAAKRLTAGITALVEQGMNATGTRSAQARLSAGNPVEFHEGKDHYYLTQQFNPAHDSGKYPGYAPASDATLRALADHVRRGIEGLLPEVRAILEDDQYLQPVANPNGPQVAAFNAEVEGKWAAAIEQTTRDGYGRAVGDTRPVRRPPGKQDE
jgi:hypothetical protein